MALIKCSECGREISDKAETCPACGSPLQDKKIQKPVVIEQTSKSWKVIQLISGILIIVGLFMVFGNAASRGSADLAAKQMGNFFAGLGIIGAGLGVIGLIIGKMGAWWNNR